MTRLFAALLFVLVLDAAPTVSKVEPPNWWFPHSLNPVRILIRGTGLTGATLRSTDAAVEVGSVRVNERGTFLFADLKLSGTGQHPLKVVSSSGEASVPFEVLPPLPRAGRFQGFSPDDMVYLIMPDRFANGDSSNDDPAISKGLFDRSKPRYYHGGDLQGVINHLGYLKDLGVTAIWLNPVYDNTNHLNEREKPNGQPVTDYHGYGAVDFYAVEEHFGDMPKFRQLVDEAHRSGIKVILDMVANHTGPYHPWVDNPPTPTWFHGTVANHLNETWRTWTLMDAHATPALQRSTLDGWFVNILPDLNQDDPEVARYINQNTLWWVGSTGLDGIRQDTLPYVPRHFWRDWMAAIKAEYPMLRVVGEMFDGDPALVSFFQGGRARFDGIDSGVDALFDFPQYYPIRRVFAEGKSMWDLATMLGHDYLYPDPNFLMTFLGLHDVKRFMNEPGATAQGLKLAFTYLMTSRGIPLIYYGDEIALPGGDDPDNRRDFPGGWPGDPRNAFTPNGRTTNEQNVFAHLQKLARIRAANPDLRNGPMVQLQVSDSTYAYSRGNAIVLFNNAVQAGTIECPAANGLWRDALGGMPDVTVRDGTMRAGLAGRSSAIFVR